VTGREEFQMLLVLEVTGPPAVKAGELAAYRVSSFSEPDPSPEAVAGVRWLIKAADGGVLAHATGQGRELRLTIPEHWAGQVLVMAYIRTPSASVACRTMVQAAAESHADPARSGPRRIDVVAESGRYYASVNGEPRFYVGTDVRYGPRRGLTNAANPPGPRYRPQDFEAAHGDWAWYLFPTITCESRGHFTCLNTYDRASFTFGHIQLGAHTPEDNFVLLFRELLSDPAASEYFPELRLSNGRIHLLNGSGGLEPLESAASTAALMSYFNPRADRVDLEEAEKSARLVDWSIRHANVRDRQVAFVVRQQRRKLRQHARKLPLDGTVDKLCLVVLDILHQGRAGYNAIGTALAANDPFDALLSLGASQYRERVATLRAGIRDLEASGRVGAKVFEASSGEFVVPAGA
jgi:hypothetical protein